MKLRALSLVVVLLVIGSVQAGSADPVDDVIRVVCSLLPENVDVELLDCDADGDGYSPGQGDCDDADPAIHPGAQDDPDLAFVDSNCDGIDGDESRSIFVSTGGLDGSPGTRLQPKRTIQAGIAAAAPHGYDVLVISGEYETGGGLVLATGVSIFGGYGAAWSRPSGSASIVRGAPQAALASGVTDIVLQLITLSAQNGGDQGNAYGLRALSSSLRLERVVIQAGPGRDGGVGGPGVVGGPANNGSAGIAGSCDNNVSAPGGAGGFSPVGRNGGAGGNGRYALSGVAGFSGSGAGGGGGGAGGSAGVTGQPGLNGQPGQHGSDGFNGAGGGNAPFSAGDHWIGLSGANGGQGAHGGGGGGGGAGGGQDGVFVIDGTGNGGGGGGAGGAGGAAGVGGAAGGGSFGLYLHNSSVAVTEGSTVAAGQGGRGWMGSNGNPGQQGGAGGFGAGYCTDEIGRGGNGGAGGNGGRGGAGGGGAGGPSIGAFRDAASTLIFSDSPQPTHGPGGPGGQSYAGAAWHGSVGLSVPVYP